MPCHITSGLGFNGGGGIARAWLSKYAAKARAAKKTLIVLMVVVKVKSVAAAASQLAVYGVRGPIDAIQMSVDLLLACSEERLVVEGRRHTISNITNVTKSYMHTRVCLAGCWR